MPDVLIRDVSEDVVAALEARARSQGISTDEYLRRFLRRCASEPTGSTAPQE